MDSNPSQMSYSLKLWSTYLDSTQSFRYTVNVYVMSWCLFHRSPDVSDLVETFPSLGQSLMDIKNYDGDNFVDTFDLNFTCESVSSSCNHSHLHCT